MKTELLTWCDQAVAATATGVYQGILLTIFVALALRLLGRTNAATRHSIWLTTLLLLPAIIAAHYVLDPRGCAPRSPAENSLLTDAGDKSESQATDELAGVGTEQSAEHITRLDLRTEMAVNEGGTVPTSPTEPGAMTEPPVPWSERPELEMLVLPAVISRSTPPPAKEPLVVSGPVRFASLPEWVWEGLRSSAARLSEPVSWSLPSSGSFPRIASAVVLGIWAIVGLARLTVLAFRLHGIRKLKSASIPADEGLRGNFNELRTRLGLKRGVQLRVSPVHRSPVVLGFLHPVILLPSAEVLPSDPAETEHILRHELAHVRRGDDWANLVQHCLQAALFFHPGVWWISRRLSLEREIACDDQVLHQLGRPRTYALTLANLASRMKRCPPLLAPGASTNNSQLQQRIDMILNTNRNSSPLLAKTRLGFITSAAALFAVLAIASGPRLVLAQSSALTAPPAAVSVRPDVTIAVQTTPPSVSVAQNEAPTATVSVESDSGPRFKPDQPEQPPAPPATTALPAPPVAGVAPVPPAAPLIVAVPNAMPSPAPYPPSANAYVAMGKRGEKGSLEQRLERLERMVHSLMAQQNGWNELPGHPMPKPEGNFNFDYKFNFDEKQMGKIKEMAQREAERAKAEAGRAQDQAERAQRDMERAMKEKGKRARGAQKEAAEHQLDALRRAKENLERQMERLDSQIEKLEQDHDRMQQDQERLQEEQERHSELRGQQERHTELQKNESSAGKAAVAGLETE